MNSKFVSYLIIYFAGVILLLFLFYVLPSMRRSKKRRAMYDSVTTGDEISTIGGIIGTVVDRDNETVTLMVDRKTNTTIKVVLPAIQVILSKSVD